MKNLKKIATTLTLTGIIMMGVTSTKAGLLMSDFAGGEQPCTTVNTDINIDSAVIVSGFTGVIVSGFMGVIVSGLSSDNCEQVNHGLLMTD